MNDKVDWEAVVKEMKRIDGPSIMDRPRWVQCFSCDECGNGYYVYCLSPYSDAEAKKKLPICFDCSEEKRGDEK